MKYLLSLVLLYVIVVASNAQVLPLTGNTQQNGQYTPVGPVNRSGKIYVYNTTTKIYDAITPDSLIDINAGSSSPIFTKAKNGQQWRDSVLGIQYTKVSAKRWKKDFSYGTDTTEYINAANDTISRADIWNINNEKRVYINGRWVTNTTVTLNNITALQSYNGGSLQVLVTDSLRGGIFNLKTLTGNPIDSGVVFSSAISGYVWVRQITNELRASWYNVCNTANAQTVLTNMFNSAMNTYKINAIIDCNCTTGGGFTISKPLRIYGDKNAVITRTGISNSSVFFQIGGGKSTGTPRFVSVDTFYNLGSGALSKGNTTYTFDRVTGLNIGDELMIFLGIDENDNGQYRNRYLNTITNISGNTVTFSAPLNENILAFPGSPTYAFSPTFHRAVKFSAGIDGFELSNLKLKTIQNGSAYDVDVYVNQTKNFIAKNLNFSSPTIAIDLAECFSPTIQNIVADSAVRSFIGSYGTTNLTGTNLTVTNLQGTGIYLENQMRGAALTGVNLIGSVTKANNSYIAVNGNSKNVNINGYNIAASTNTNAPILSLVNSKPNLQNGNITESGIINLQYTSGTINVRDTTYTQTKNFRATYLYVPNSTTSFFLPSGLYKRVTVLLPDTTGISTIKFVNPLGKSIAYDKGNTIDYISHGTLMDMSVDYFTSLSNNNAYIFNQAATNKTLEIVATNSTDLAFITIEIEYYAAFGDNTQPLIGLQNLLSVNSKMTVNSSYNPTLILQTSLNSLSASQATAMYNTVTNQFEFEAITQGVGNRRIVLNKSYGGVNVGSTTSINNLYGSNVFYNSTAGNPITLLSLQAGTTTDSIITSQAGVLKRMDLPTLSATLSQSGNTSIAVLATGATGTATITFSPTFATVPNIVVSPNVNVGCYITAVSTSGATITCTNNTVGALTPSAIYWIARK